MSCTFGMQIPSNSGLLPTLLLLVLGSNLNPSSWEPESDYCCRGEKGRRKGISFISPD